jgi:hypothetical protein
VVSGIVSRFHPSVDVVTAFDLPFVNMRRVAEGLQLLGNPKRPVAIAARVADEDIGHALSLSTLVIVQRFGGDIFGPRSGRFNPAAPLGEAWQAGLLPKRAAHTISIFSYRKSIS